MLYLSHYFGQSQYDTMDFFAYYKPIIYQFIIDVNNILLTNLIFYAMLCSQTNFGLKKTRNLEKGEGEMRKKHLEIERKFYDEAYRDPATRLDRGYGWDVKPSPSMVKLFEKHLRDHYIPIPNVFRESWVLDIGIGADGRNAQFFLQQGYRIMGVDISMNALQCCADNWYKKYTGHVIIEKLDMTLPNVTKYLGNRFRIIIDWSAMDHIRREYLPTYKANILKCLKPGGYLISSQFASPMPEKFKPYNGKDYYLWKGHYMRCFTVESLIAEFPELDVVDYLPHCPEDAVNGILIHTVLFQKKG